MELMPMLKSGLSAFKVFVNLKLFEHYSPNANTVKKGKKIVVEVAANLLIFLPQMFLVLCLQKSPPIMIINNSKRLRSENITKEIEKSVERIKIMDNVFHRARSPQPVTLTHLERSPEIN